MPISTPTKIGVPWAASGLKNPIPPTSNPISGNAGYDQGFTAINMTPKTAGGIPPFGQDFNGILFDITEAIRFQQAGGSFPYDSAWATAVGGYPAGAIVSRTDNQGFWRNTAPNNLTDPEAGGAGWQPEGSGVTSVAMTSSNVTLTYLQAARNTIVITGALTANLQLIFPAYQKQWLVVNSTSGGFSITCKTSAGSGVAVPSGSNVQLYGDGVDVKNFVSQVSMLPVGYFSGFNMANDSVAPNTTIDVAPGAARDSTDTFDVRISSTLRGILQASGSWAAGDNQNKLDVGSRANNTWYHVFAIRKTSDGSGDILFSLSATAPTMPSGYAGFALIESVQTDASGIIRPFLNVGREMLWKTARQDVALDNPAIGNTTVTISTPPGRRVRVKQYLAIAGNAATAYTHSPEVNNETITNIGVAWRAGISTNNPAITDDPLAGYVECVTGASSNIVLQTYSSSANLVVVQLATMGWEKI